MTAATSPRLTRALLGITALGAALGGLEARVHPRRALFAYAAAFEAALAVALGALLFLVIAITARARWFLVFQRVASAIATTLPVFPLLFLPLAFGVRTLYPWAPAAGGGIDAALDPAATAWVAHVRPWLNPPFFVARAYLYLATWSILAILLRRLSRRGDAAAPPIGSERLLAAAAIPILAVTLTAASFDWLMSLDPRWASDMVGVYVFAGAFGGAMGTIAIGAWLAREGGYLPSAVAPDHFHALGRVLLVSVIFWAYIAFCQFLLVWIADLDRESAYYAARGFGPWAYFAGALVVVHFVVPFLLLLSWALKRKPRLVALTGAIVLCGHALDAYWLVLPPLHAGPSLLDVGFFLAVGGGCALLAIRRFVAAPAVPIHHPALAEIPPLRGIVSAVEEDRIPGRAIAITAIVAIAVGAVGVGVASGILLLESTGRRAPATPAHASAEIGIVEQTLIGSTRRGLDERARQKEALTRFGWADRKHGIARIPIDRAMDLVVDPAFDPRALESRPDAGAQGGT